MPHSCVDSLVSQVRQEVSGVRWEGDLLGSGLWRGLAPVPHDGAKESEIGSRQRPAIYGKRGHVVAAIPVLDANHAELRILRHGERDTDQTAAQQKTIGGATCVHGGRIEVAAVGAVIGAENRIQTL